METSNNRAYGFLGRGDSEGIIEQKKGQYISGYSVGILFLDECWYPVLPGNVANLTTYNYPVRLKVVPDCIQSRIHAGDPTLVDDIIKAAKGLEAEGARAISAACGFFGNFQSQVAASVDTPVFLSTMIQVNWIKPTLKPGQKIGVLTADAHGITDKLFKSCGIEDPSICVIKDLGHLPEFSAIIESRGAFDNKKVRKEVVQAAMELVKGQDEFGAILCECSDLPPYASDIQQAVKLPVYDFITMINYAHNATSQKPYYGFI